MKAIAIADDDGLVGHLDVTGVDLLLCLGDLWDSTIAKAVARYAPGRTFGVRGNHDTDAPFSGPVTSLHNTLDHHSGLVFGGFGGSWRYKPGGHHLYDQEEVSRIMRSFPPVDVFIAHNSPWGIHQRDEDVHQGFHGLLEYLQRTKPRYFIHGHQHLNITTELDGTQVIGVFGEALIELA